MDKKIKFIVLGCVCLLTLAGVGIGYQGSSGKVVETMASGSWGLSFQEEGKAPVIDVDANELKELEGYYLGDEAKKKIYITFDAGFENGNTPKILDALKKHNVKATFFLVGNYLETCPDLVKRMEEEGHTVGNHTYHHKDMDTITTEEAFLKELQDLEKKYQEITGKEMDKFYRPPQGKYCENQLNWAKDQGYKTIFWSLAYVDWNENSQPSKEEAMEKLTGRIHPGAIVLLHSTSDTNGNIMDDILTKWEEMGYTFGTLDEL
ncbi:MAG: polysaccharide deacetylase family protein [Lachnospiraceae bacterium]|nr:polysaccharide deacetylase family protein [Lachnospiraceae bacterium]